jgi:hypothetical protein
MRFLRDNKGQVRVIEAFIASLLLLSSFTMIPTAQRITQSSTMDLTSTARNVLANLDNNGHLAHLVDEENWVSLRSCIQSLIPLTIWFNVTVFDENMNVVNTTPLCSGSQVGKNVIAIDYICVSPSSCYSIHIIRLQLAGIE